MRGIVINYPCAKFGDFSFSRFGFIVRTDRQTESQNTDRIIEADQRHGTFGTVVNPAWYAVP